MSRVWLHLGFFGGGVLYGFITFCVYGAQCMHHVGVISGVFSFCYVMMGRKVSIFILSQHVQVGSIVVSGSTTIWTHCIATAWESLGDSHNSFLP